VLSLGQQGLGEDQAGRRVVRPAPQALPAGGHGLTGPSGLAVEIGQLGEGQGIGVPRHPLLVPPDRVDEAPLVHH